MIRIGICEDEKQQAERIEALATAYFFSRTEYELYRYASGEAVVEAVEQGCFRAELLFLDIHMGGMSGLETAAYLRSHRVDVDIIFITVSEQDVYEGYTYKAFSYILKSKLTERLPVELDRYLREMDETPECMQIYVNGTVRKLRIGQVRYFESHARKITAHLKQEELEFYSRMDELEELLESRGFVRCHQSFLVNEVYVTLWNREFLSLSDKVIPVSRKYCERLKTEGRFSGTGSLQKKDTGYGRNEA